MNRKRRFSNVVKQPPLPSFSEFCASLPHLDNGEGLATSLDLYCALSQLHGQGVTATLRKSSRFHYFVALGSSWEDEDIIIPVSCRYGFISLNFLQSLFTEPEGAGNLHIDLALVDADGSMTKYRLYNSVKPPSEGLNRTKRRELGD
ncbi:hypothetical protein BSKO_01600 [Bryopsis sp. KO-2023]|nr:hypothetical protein BSKO_01600 [Bryopsis sp. KO-2023]